MKSICFVTTGDIKDIATAKRALGLANPLSDLGWQVSIIMEDTEENRHRVGLECRDDIRVCYFPRCHVSKELAYKRRLLREIDPDFVYLCAFVVRNIVGWRHTCRKLVEHSELQTGIDDRKGLRRMLDYIIEYASLIYADGLLNASAYLQDIYRNRAKHLPFKGNMPMLYFPYAYNPQLVDRCGSKLPGNMAAPCFYENKTVFIYLGTITRNYGAFTIVEAARLLKEKTRDFCVILLGRGRDYEETLRLVREYDLESHVYLPGFVEEEYISAYFSIASAFISPMNDSVQDWARCPSKLYMYLPYRKPIITCKIGEPYQVLREDGLYYSPNDSEGLQNQMLKVIHKEFASLDIDSKTHTWEFRAMTLNTWIKQNFSICQK